MSLPKSACTCALIQSLLIAALAVSPAAGEVTAEEAAQLNSRLTPVGAERAGNAEGTIPEWTGGITEVPDGYEAGDWHLDPFETDPVLLTITAENAAEHAEYLSDGQRALLAAYPESWKLQIYPSHRSASYPDYVYEAMKQNATSAILVTGGKGGVTGARVTSPFPIPKSGLEVIWNHNLRYRGVRISRSEGRTAVTRRGSYRLIQSIQELGIPYSTREENSFSRRHPNVMLAIKEKIFAPALLSGDGTLVIETINQTNDPRKAWSYSRALRRVIRNPYVAYHFPSGGSGGLRTVDDSWLFVGPPDRFKWQLHGKRELYIPYNAYRLHSGEVGDKEILDRHHINPELARYELHRVWVLEAILKSGAEHIYGRRIFYVDEDSWQITLAESYDRQGRLWRVNEAHGLNYYEVPLHWDTLLVFHDLKERRYSVNGVDNGRSPPHFQDGGDPREFNPNALLYYVR